MFAIARWYHVTSITTKSSFMHHDHRLSTLACRQRMQSLLICNRSCASLMACMHSSSRPTQMLQRCCRSDLRLLQHTTLAPALPCSAVAVLFPAKAGPSHVHLAHQRSTTVHLLHCYHYQGHLFSKYAWSHPGLAVYGSLVNQVMHERCC